MKQITLTIQDNGACTVQITPEIDHVPIPVRFDGDRTWHSNSITQAMADTAEEMGIYTELRDLLG